MPHSQDSKKRQKHPKCAGFWTDTPEGRDFDCDYNTHLLCEDCKYGHGRKDPEARCNQAS